MRGIGKRDSDDFIPEAGVEIARWATKGGAHWISLVEDISPVVGALWCYSAPNAAGGFVQSEGYDRERAFAEMCRMAHNAYVLDGNKIRCTVNPLNLVEPVFAEGEVAKSVFASDRGQHYRVGALLARANSMNVPEGALTKVARDFGADDKTALEGGLAGRLEYLLDEKMSFAAINELLDEYARPRANTPSDLDAIALLNSVRTAAAERAFEGFEFAAPVEGTDGWQSAADNGVITHLQRIVYVEPELGPDAGEDSASLKVSFSVEFRDRSAAPASVSALYMESGNEAGFMPEPAEGPR